MFRNILISFFYSSILMGEKLPEPEHIFTFKTVNGYKRTYKELRVKDPFQISSEFLLNLKREWRDFVRGKPTHLYFTHKSYIETPSIDTILNKPPLSNSNYCALIRTIKLEDPNIIQEVEISGKVILKFSRVIQNSGDEKRGIPPSILFSSISNTSSIETNKSNGSTLMSIQCKFYGKKYNLKTFPSDQEVLDVMGPNFEIGYPE